MGWERRHVIQSQLLEMEAGREAIAFRVLFFSVYIYVPLSLSPFCFLAHSSSTSLTLTDSFLGDMIQIFSPRRPFLVDRKGLYHAKTHAQFRPTIK